MKTLVVGYYYHNNFGDDMYHSVFPIMLQISTDIHFVNIEKLHKIKADEYKIIILGGGDVMSSYFLKKFHKWHYNQKVTIPCYAYSIGIPYLSALEEGQLDIFDYIICRNKGDTKRMKNRYGNKYIRYLPDFVFSHPIPQNLKFEQLNITHITKPIVSIFLAKPCMNHNILKKISIFLNSHPQYQFISYSLNTNMNNGKENDISISKELQKLSPSLLVVEGKADYTQIISLLKRSYFAICTRLHSHVFSIMSHTPFISIFSTRKVRNLLDDFKLNHMAIPLHIKCHYCHYIIEPPISSNQNIISSYQNGCKSCLNMCGIPFDLNLDKLNAKHRRLIKNRHHLYNKLVNIHNNNVQMLADASFELPNIIKRTTQPLFLNLEFIQETKDNICQEMVKYIANYVNVKIDNDYVKNIARRLLKNKLKVYLLPKTILNDNISKKELKLVMNELADLIAYKLTGTLRPDFHYGLTEQIGKIEYNLNDSLNYIIKHVHTNTPHSQSIDINDYSKLNLLKMTQEKLIKCHYSGWEYVINSLTKHLHNPKGILFNGFIDRTFLWEYDFNKRMNIIPYTEHWTGFIHHAINNKYSKHSCVTLFERPLFLESLQHCSGLFVMSKYLKEWIDNRLNELNLNVKVNYLIHPTIIPDLEFNYQKFEKQHDKKILHIGGWYRNPYAFYELDTTLTKLALQGKNMHNYFKPDIFKFDDILIMDCKECQKNDDCDEHDVNGSACGHDCEGTYRNNQYLKGMVKHLKKRYQSVNIYHNLDNKEYDNLLSKSIVFLYLVDCSASNTVTECIVRNTPLLINPHPAVVELLGVDYPFYYETIREAEEKSNNMLLIRLTHYYLKIMSKDKYSIQYFIDSIIKSDIYKSIVINNPN